MFLALVRRLEPAHPPGGAQLLHSHCANPGHRVGSNLECDPDLSAPPPPDRRVEIAGTVERAHGGWMANAAKGPVD